MPRSVRAASNVQSACQNICTRLHVSTLVPVYLYTFVSVNVWVCVYLRVEMYLYLPSKSDSPFGQNQLGETWMDKRDFDGCRTEHQIYSLGKKKGFNHSPSFSIFAFPDLTCLSVGLKLNLHYTCMYCKVKRTLQYVCKKFWLSFFKATRVKAIRWNLMRRILMLDPGPRPTGWWYRNSALMSD